MEKKSVKIVTIGGGSSYTPELMEGFIKRYDELPVRDLWLVDIEEGKHKLEIVGNLAKRIGLSDALRSWSGQELTHKDFSFENTWYEAKAISRGAQSVRISSLEQLDSDNPGELVVHVLEKMSAAYKGITLNKLILETRNMFSTGDERDLFMSKVALQGYEYNNYYDDFVYEIVSFSRYYVDNNFPKLTIKTVPSGIRKVTYDISLVDIASFEIKD